MYMGTPYFLVYIDLLTLRVNVYLFDGIISYNEISKEYGLMEKLISESKMNINKNMK